MKMTKRKTAVEKMAAQSEEGYDIEEILRRRGGRPTLGSAPATVESVRLSPELKRDTKPATIAVFAEQRDGLFNYGQNDMQAVAQRLCPEITDVIHIMSQMGLKGRMTGSGSAVFAWLPMPSVKFLEQQEQQLKNISQQFKICKNLSQHPLYNT